MSNLAKQNIKIPKNISLELSSSILICTGPLGKEVINLSVAVEITDGYVKVLPVAANCSKKISKSLNIKALQGTTASLLKQVFTSLTYGFRKKLKLVGVGYKVAKKKVINKMFLELKLGFSHLCEIEVPENLNVTCSNPVTINISGHNRQSVSNFAAYIRSYKFPEPYKGKGILYEDEKIILKDGKRS